MAAHAAAEQGRPQVIRYLTFETSYQQIALLRKIIAAFEERNPDIKVKLEATADASRIFMTDAAAGTPPDVMYIGTEFLAQLTPKHIVQPLDELVRRDGVDMDIYYPETVKALTFDASSTRCRSISLPTACSTTRTCSTRRGSRIPTTPGPGRPTATPRPR